ncbi:MAG: YdcF family protein [Sulfuricaulis sp.]|nr:YdcF family protein [Sulfuricaulis sp.]
MVDIVSKIQALFLLPPGIIIVIGLLGFLIQIRWLLVGSIIVALSFTALLILSLPFTGQRLIADIESRYPPLRLTAVADGGPPPGAIIILGGGRYTEAPEYGDGDSVSQATLGRIRYGAHLHRLTGLPILVSGGTPYGEQVSEAVLMKTALESDFQVAVKWVESKSANTLENARYTKLLLAQAGVRRAYLVTHAWHMPRALWSFESEGMSTIPAPMGFTTLNKEDRETLGYFPSASGMHLSSVALREQLGIVWYKLKHDSAKPPPATTPAPAN